MAAPSQLQVKYIPEEDRVYWRINTFSDEEFRFWLTRRFLSRLWPVLRDALFASPKVAQQVDKTAQKAVMSFEHEKVTSKATFNVEFKKPKTMPLGEKALLLTQARFKQLPDGGLLLTLQSIDKVGVDFNLSNELLHLLCDLLDKAAVRSDWEFPPLVKKESNIFIDAEPPPKERFN